MKKKIKIDIKSGYIHYYFDDFYLGMLVFSKGELSDFRAIIRKNKLKINEINLFENLRIGLFELLNQYLAEREFLDAEQLQIIKNEIVNENENVLAIAAKEIIDNKVMQNDK